MPLAERPILDYTPLYHGLADSPLAPWLEWLPQQVASALEPTRHGDVPQWLRTLRQFPVITPSTIELNRDTIRIGQADDLSVEQQSQLQQLLLQFQPWRKGPFELFGIAIDTEWRSDWKWRRLAEAIDPLQDRLILDVGSGNGYYGWRMVGAGAKQVLGIDPTLRYLMQFGAIDHFIAHRANTVLPLRLEQLATPIPCFDTLFSMGVIYHQRDPLAHLRQLGRYLRPGGQLILEGLVIEGTVDECLIPKKRYAKMHNVYALPSVPMLLEWLRQSGYHSVELVDVTPTTPEEQRRTRWMVFESLADYLDPTNPALTIEGYPAPIRAIATAKV
ncbi:tRNA 5-methoxyuridine(34)/uridine 5-oxyacetic acid(34) synthase CmoB [Ectothiorhodospiraceae bacterium BW-2]|nr:tRNA 5-methoxyuridine(34)/uridine 5-oxyacetic acid(34) synthase CmoB [Ectothiorhodospiraceae bacterium BW-2]